MLTALLALSLAADPADAPKGKLVPVGGGTTTKALTQRILKEAGGPDARVLVVPQASSLADSGDKSAEMWRGLGAKSVSVLSLADAAAAARAVESADLIWMPGGDQNRLMAALAKADLPAAIRKRFYAGAVVGGTSAGAAVVSHVMLTGDAELDKLKRGTTRTADGLGLWTRAIVDQHFVKRERMSRLLSLVLDHPTLVGVGIDESTGVIVTGSKFEVIGSSQVVVIDARKAAVGDGKPGDAAAVTGVTVSVLTPGMTFDLDAK